MSETGVKRDQVVRYEVQDGVAVVTLDRPERLNAWTPALGAEYFAALDRAVDDSSVRVIVVTGSGRGFCAGADMDLLQAVGSQQDDSGAELRDARSQYYPTTLPKPVIAAINGPAAGIGLVMALFCDIRFAAEGAKLTTAFSRRGLVAE
ncbi:MAG: enoyl-CoA hydratase-related protein, partial [Acidimicrobiales bacterium]